MKRLVGTLAVLALLLPGTGAFAQSSDFEIIESYKSKSQALAESIKETLDPALAAGLNAEIDNLEADYAQHRKLLAAGLHPGNLDTSIAALRDQLKKKSEKLRLEEQNRKSEQTIQVMTQKTREDARQIEKISQENVEFRAQVERLTQEIQSLSQQVEKLTSENSDLLAQVKALQAEGRRDKESIAKLKALTEKLNANVRDRDELIVKMMDAMTREYEKAGMTDAQKRNLFVNVQGYDYVGKIISTVDGNIRYAEAAVMSAADFATARAEQQKLAAKWNEIKPNVGKLYPDEQARVRDLATVDSRLADWKARIDEAVWRGMNQAFAVQGVDIGQFRNAAEFQERLLAYIDGQTQSPSREKYQAFKTKVWDSPIRDQWLPAVPMEELTAPQRAVIEERIAQWDQAIRSRLRLMAMIGALALVVVVALVAFAVTVSRRKKAAAP